MKDFFLILGWIAIGACTALVLGIILAWLAGTFR